MHLIRRTTAAAAVIGVVAAVGVAVAGVVLADIYRPHAPGAALADLPAAVRRSDRWTDWHRIASAALLLAATVSFALVAALVVGATGFRRRKALVIGAVVVTVVMSVVTVITRPLVEWDQLALSSVTVGSDVDGYWTAAFGGDVRFVLIGNTEVSQGAYRSVLLAHLAAPVVAALALLLLGAVVGRAPDERPDDGAVSPP